MAKYEDPNQLDYRNGGDTVDDFAQKYMRTIAYVFKALNDLRTPTGNTAGVEPEPYMWRIADNKLYIRNADNTDYVLLGEISPNFGFRQSVNDRFLTTADLEGDGAVVTRNEAGKVEGDITGSPGKIADKTIDVTPSADNDVIAYDAAQQKWVKKTLNDYLKKQGDAGWDEMVDEVADQVIEDITPIIFNFWYLDEAGYLVPLVGSTEGGLPSIHGMVGDYEQITARSVDVAGNFSATGNVTAGMLTTPQANVTTLTANAVNAGTVTANDIIAKGPIVDVRAFGAKGDGVTDDTQAIQAAIDYAEAIINTGKTVTVLLSKHLVTTLYIGNNGDDAFRTKLIFYGGTLILSNNTKLFTKKNNISNELVGNLLFQNVQFISTNNAGATIISGYPFLRNRFDHCTFSRVDTVIDGVTPIMAETTSSFIQSYRFTNCDFYGGNALFKVASSEDVVVDNCIFEGQIGYILRQFTDSNDNYNPIRWAFTNSLLEDIKNTDLIYITSCAKFTFTNNTLEEIYRAIHFDAYGYVQASIDNNVFVSVYNTSHPDAGTPETYIKVSNTHQGTGSNDIIKITAVGNNITRNPLFDISDLSYKANLRAYYLNGMIYCRGTIANNYVVTKYQYKADDNNLYANLFPDCYGAIPLQQIDDNVYPVVNSDYRLTGKYLGVGFVLRQGDALFGMQKSVNVAAGASTVLVFDQSLVKPSKKMYYSVIGEGGIIYPLYMDSNDAGPKFYIKNTNSEATTFYIVVRYSMGENYFGYGV